MVLALNHRRKSILDHYNVNEMEVEIIHFLNEHEMKKMKEVGEHFNIKLSTLTSTIDKLEKNRLVKRKNSKDDRRVIYIRPTSRGQNLLVDLDESMKSISEFTADGLKEAEFEGLNKGLENMLKFLKQAG